MSEHHGLVPLSRLAAGLTRAWHEVEHVVDVVTSRRQLAEMDDRMLKDLGISRAQAEFEASRAPWHTQPASRRRN